MSKMSTVAAKQGEESEKVKWRDFFHVYEFAFFAISNCLLILLIFFGEFHF